MAVPGPLVAVPLVAVPLLEAAPLLPPVGVPLAGPPVDAPLLLPPVEVPLLLPPVDVFPVAVLPVAVLPVAVLPAVEVMSPGTSGSSSSTVNPSLMMRAPGRPGHRGRRR